MNYVIIREISASKKMIAWTQSEFLFREYLRVSTRKLPYNKFHIECCQTENELKWIFKKYDVTDTDVSDSRIILVYDKSKTVYGLTTCRSQRVGLGGRSLFQNKEDSVRCEYVHKLFWFVTCLKRFSFADKKIIDIIYALVSDKFLDRHSIDMYRYLIESDDQTNFYKL